MTYVRSLWVCIITLALSGVLDAQQLKVSQQIEGFPPRIEYRAIAHDGAGNTYVATSVDVFMIPYNRNRAQPMSVGDQIVDVDWSKEDGLLLLSKDGTIRFAATGKTLSVDAGEGATCMDVTKSVIWVGTHKGVYTLSIAQEKIIDHFTTEDGVLVSNEITFIHSDPFNIRWIGTKAGVVRIQGKKWKLYEEDHAVTAITSTSEGAWMAADDNMWLVNSYNRWFPINAWRDLVKGKVKALSSDSKEHIYIASDILVKYDPYEEKILSMNEGGTMDQLIILSQGPGKNVWMAGHTGMSTVVEDTTQVIVPVVKGDQLAAVMDARIPKVCPGMQTGHLIVKTAGGKPPYRYQWDHDGSTGEEATNLAAGIYKATVTDQEGKSIVATGIISTSPAITLSVRMDKKSTDKLAADGRASSIVKGGAEPFQYLWSNGETNSQAVTLTEGTHTLRVIDANGCIANSNIAMEADKVLKTLDISTLALGQTIRVDKLYFEADSSTIQSASYAVLEEIFTFLKDNDKVVIEVGGHTNSLPEDEYCDRLSTARAKNIASFLYEKGIPEAQLSFKGYGKRQPIATNQTVEGRRRNQRVEIKIISL